MLRQDGFGKRDCSNNLGPQSGAGGPACKMEQKRTVIETCIGFRAQRRRHESRAALSPCNDSREVVKGARERGDRAGEEDPRAKVHRWADGVCLRVLPGAQRESLED